MGMAPHVTAVHDRLRAGMGFVKTGPIPMLDLIGAAGLALWSIAAAWTWDGLAIPFLLLATTPLMLRRVNPRAAVGLTFLGGIGLFSGGIYPINNAAIAFSAAVSLYTLLLLLPRRKAWVVALLAIMALPVLAALRGGLGYSSIGMLAGLAQMLVPYGLGIFGVALVADLSRSRSEVREVRQEGLDQMIAAQREQAAMAERARIARELHDIVAHSISRIAVEAETAPYTIKDLSSPAREGFEQIATTARETLTEMRRLLGVLRTDGRAAGGTAPQPGLARLPELLDEHRRAGGTVYLDIIGHAVPLPAAIDLSAYRILQESLTNIRTHAPGASARIELAYLPEVLSISVADDGPGPSDDQGGHGLIGMRERVGMLGGWMSCGTAPEGGFLVEAGLPLEPA